MSKDTEKLSITAHPMRSGESDFFVNDFASFISSLKNFATKLNCGNVRIKSISSNSPVKITLEAEEQLHHLYSDLSEFTDSYEIPSDWRRDKVDTFLEFLNPIGKFIGHLEISAGWIQNERGIVINTEHRHKFANSIGEDYFVTGTIDGMLESVNIHGKQNSLAIYPVIGKSKITCNFADNQLNKVKKFIGQYVEISGEIKYRWRDSYPHSATVDSIEIIEEEGLPKFSDLYGIAPNATGGMAAEEFIAKLRSQWTSH